MELRAAVAENGWTEVDVEKHEGLTAMLSVNPDSPGRSLHATAFAHYKHPGIFTMISKTMTDAAHILDCHVVTFDPTADFSDGDLQPLGAAQSDAEVSDLPILHSAVWQPGLFPGHAETSIHFLPAVSEIRDLLPSPAPYIMILGRSATRSNNPTPLRNQ